VWQGFSRNFPFEFCASLHDSMRSMHNVLLGGRLLQAVGAEFYDMREGSEGKVSNRSPAGLQ
jgi:hypothetical protein